MSEGSAGLAFRNLRGGRGTAGSGQDAKRGLEGPCGLPGIALSGYGMEEDVRNSLEAGFLKHITKPVSFQALETAIRHALRRETS